MRLVPLFIKVVDLSTWSVQHLASLYASLQKDHFCYESNKCLSFDNDPWFVKKVKFIELDYPFKKSSYNVNRRKDPTYD